MSSGLTLAEVVLSVGFLTIIGVTIAGVFIHLLSASAKTSDLTAGRSLARRVLDRAVRAGPPDWGYPTLTTQPDDSKTGSEVLVTQATQTSSEFDFTLRWKPLKTPDTGVPGVSREIYYIEVEVSWWEDASRAEMGMLTTKISQVAGYHR